MTESRLTDAKIAVLKTHGITCFDDIVDFDESQGLITFSDGTVRRKTEVWDRCMGYFRPVAAFNPGKQAEHAERVYFTESRVQFLDGAGHD